MPVHALKKYTNERGTVLGYLVFTLSVLVLFAAFAIDLGTAYTRRQQLRAGIDAAALAGARRLAEGAVDDATLRSAVFEEAEGIAASNFVHAANLAASDGVELGQWNAATREFVLDAQPYNAVRVSARSGTSTFFAHIFGHTWLSFGGVSVAALSGLGSAICLPPFAVDDDVINGLVPGQRFVLGRNSPGNWGKIDLRDDIRGEQDFREAIRDGVCDVEVNVGQSMNTITGFSGVDNGIDDRLLVNPIMLLPVVLNFPNGTSSDTEVLGFIEAQVISTSGSGSNWQVEMELREAIGGFEGGGPSNVPFVRSRVLVM